MLRILLSRSGLEALLSLNSFALRVSGTKRR